MTSFIPGEQLIPYLQLIIAPVYLTVADETSKAEGFGEFY
jgi:hypothetical protein